MPSSWRMLLLAVSVCFCFILSADGAGAQTADDHSDSLNTATDLPLGTPIAGRIAPAEDNDIFKLDLSGASGPTDVWIYTTGALDTFGGLFDSHGNLLVSNGNSRLPGRETAFHIRRSLPSGVYYVGVGSYRTGTGDYTLHAEAVTGPGSAIDTATHLNLDSPTPGTIDTTTDADYFRLDFTETTNLALHATNFVQYGKGVNLAPLDVHVLDAGGTELSVNVYPVPRFVRSLDDRIGFRLEDTFSPGTYIIRVTTPDDVDSHPVPYTILALEDTGHAGFVEDCEAKTLSLGGTQASDPLYGCQWHLNNRDGEDINVEPVWADGFKGEGVNVAVVDDGLYFTHEDLRDNVDATRNHDYTSSGIDHPLEHHGTNVAGVMSARDNGIGARGVAPRATIYGYNYLADSTDSNLVDAMSRNRDVTAVSNNSWGPRDGPGLDLAGSLWELAVDQGTTNGHDGKGTFYAFAGGNGHLDGDNANLDEFANYYGVTAVCAVNEHGTRSSYSEMGANLWVCAPSGDRAQDYRGIVTTENSDRYVDDFSGTSASTPAVSGVAALLRGANPALTWRDLKLILAASARRNDAGNPGWEEGAHKYGSNSAADRYHFNHEYGFGVVDAGAALDLARGWTNAPPLRSSTAEARGPSVRIPDAPAVGNPTTVTRTLALDTGIEFTEFVEVTVSFQHGSFRDLEIELESPTGRVSKLAVPFDTYIDDDPSLDFVPLRGEFRFGSARHLGEDPNGIWKLRVADRIRIEDGTLDSWSVTVYGHGRTPGPPTMDTPVAGAGSLTVTWAAPSHVAGVAVIAYDLRYIQAVVDGTVDSNWTPLEDVWTARAGGNLQYSINRLVGGSEYQVQVRGVSGTSTGPWSTAVTGTPGRVTTSACATGHAVPVAFRNPWLVADCNALLAGRDALAGSATLNWSANTPIVYWDGVTIGGTPLRVTWLELPDSQLTGAIPTELGSLTSLHVLILSENQLTGPIPPELGRLTNLVVLALWGNQLTGPIPVSLGDLANLELLYLWGNQLTGPIPVSLGNLANLEGLTLAEPVDRTDIPVSLGNLANLEGLYLSQNQLTGPIPVSLGNLANLEGLYLWGNQLTGPIPVSLGNLANLEGLYLSQNQLTGPIPPELGRLTNLVVLALWGNQLTGPIPVSLGDLANLELLYLTDNQLTGPIPTKLGRLDNLQELSLGDNELTGSLRPSLGDLANLEWLNITRNQLTGSIPPELGNLTNLAELALGGNQLTGPVPHELGGLANLEELYLWGNQLTGPIPVSLGNLANLEWLDITRNQLTGLIPLELGRLTNLVLLALGGNQLTGPVPHELGGLANLEELYLWGNQLTGPIPGSLGNLANLEGLYISRNPLTGCSPAGLRHVTEHDLDELGLPYCDVLLRGLTISPGLLTPTFDSDHTDYVAAVDSAWITVTPVKGHDSTLQLLDENRREMVDADGSLDGFQVALGDGITTIGIRVVSQDGRATLIYTIEASRATAPDVPIIGSITPGDRTLTVSWTAPSETGGADITSYDLRHIDSGAPDKADANWVVVDHAWTNGPSSYSIGGRTGANWVVVDYAWTSGLLSHTIENLAGGTQYDVQVRAATPAGSSAWSITATETNAITPSVNVTGNADALVRLNSPLLVMATFSESVSGFTVDDIVVGNGTAGNFAGGGADYTFDVTPNAIGNVTVDIAAGAATDAGGNGNTAASQLSLGIPYDDDGNGAIGKSEVIKAINDYLFGEGDEAISKGDVIRLINLYLFG